MPASMPLVRPVTAAVAALVFVLTWANFLDPLVYVEGRRGPGSDTFD